MCCRKLCLGVFWALLGVFSGLATGLAAETAPAGKVKVLYMFNGGHDGKGFVALVSSVLEGTDFITEHGSRDMPIWGDAFRAANRDESMVKLKVSNLAVYIESIQQK